MPASLKEFVDKHLRKTADGMQIVLRGVYFVEASGRRHTITPLPTFTEHGEVVIRTGDREITDWVEFVNTEGRHMWVPVRAVYADRAKFLHSVKKNLAETNGQDTK